MWTTSELVDLAEQGQAFLRTASGKFLHVVRSAADIRIAQAGDILVVQGLHQLIFAFRHGAWTEL